MSKTPDVIVLDVGGTKYKALRSTLTATSGHLRALLSEEKWTIQKQEDGSIYVEADPEVFCHLLRFMRQPEVYPLFWTLTEGFDYNLYNLLEKQAVYFQVDGLADWIRKKEYQKVIKFRRSEPKTEELQSMSSYETCANEEIERYSIKRTEKVYVCPRGILSHRGHPEQCGRQCRNARGDEPYDYEEKEVIEVVSIMKSISYDPKICSAYEMEVLVSDKVIGA
ncbi:hypothetical protein K491DRAFT_755909 [Lophiostoma macrostomum CBS 122681]|uniref:BTB domain-containing protein n=1 Tax=Lophiostoma macrostomum CBS 122681 TaxID=1314788 RepID=A0A6A6TIS9_9PLEO|nr:hypothetical protein K491DRAFT_755909 [Lophiostoma macrostomum CBS 122681]